MVYKRTKRHEILMPEGKYRKVRPTGNKIIIMKQKINISILLFLALSLIFNACSDEEEMDGGGVMPELPQSMILSNDGDNNAVNLDLSENTPWRVEISGEQAGWCEVIPASGMGPGRFIVTASPNIGRTARSTELLVTVGKDTRRLTVSQKDTLGIVVNGSNIMGNTGDTLVVAVEANTSWVVTKSDPAAGWVTFSPDRGNGKGEVKIIVDANRFPDTRGTEITFSAGNAVHSVAISQQNILPGRVSDSLTLVELYNSADGPYWSSAWDLKKEITAWEGVTTAPNDGELRVTALELSYRNLDGTLPAMIGNLSALESLNLSSNKLGGELPEGIGLLTKLKTLNLRSNKLDGEIPRALKCLAVLEELNAQDNRFTALPIEILQLPKLRIIRLDKNGIVSLPGELTATGGLEELYLNDNEIESFPIGVLQFEKLRKVRLENNRIVSLPGEITTPGGLEELNLMNNQIESFPAGILQFEKLKTVHLENNRITSLPGKLTAPGGLKELYLNDNQITSFPEGLEFLSELTKLNAANNQITVIPESITGLVALQELYLSGNKFTGGFPEGMEKMAALKIINATGCGITGPMPGWGKNGAFAKLTEVLLSGNQLTGQLTEDLGNVTNLEKLELNDNLLDGELPAEALDNTKKLKALEKFCIAGNHISGKIPAVLAKRISGYLYVLDADGFRLDGNSLAGPVPKEFKSANSKYNITANLYPQREGILEQAQ